ncbi:MAG: hypothetical protein LBM66_05250, partial [Bifidobacteriaceae bacterium]|nr:hypothetical protein [Bifidobacteriaceae bacterium]
MFNKTTRRRALIWAAGITAALTFGFPAAANAAARADVTAGAATQSDTVGAGTNALVLDPNYKCDPATGVCVQDPNHTDDGTDQPAADCGANSVCDQDSNHTATDAPPADCGANSVCDQGATDNPTDNPSDADNGGCDPDNYCGDYTPGDGDGCDPDNICDYNPPSDDYGSIKDGPGIDFPKVTLPDFDKDRTLAPNVS